MEERKDESFIDPAESRAPCNTQSLRLFKELRRCCGHRRMRETTPELLDLWGKGGDIDKVRGIAYLENGELRFTPPRELIRDIDATPIPSRELTKNIVAGIFIKLADPYPRLRLHGAALSGVNFARCGSFIRESTEPVAQSGF
ncbi:MAG: hypothetical protein QME54_00290 [Actinomycetota bacterium]|nr:hypothetical protein [Actinomycetota bacterium]